MKTGTEIRRLCACGCGGDLVKPPSTSASHFKKSRYIKGHHYAHKPIMEKQVEKMKAAHARGAFDKGCKKRREETLAKRPKCECGCGEPVRSKWAKYAVGCFDATTPENRKKALAARDWTKLSPEYSDRMANKQKEWKESGELDSIRRKGKTARGMKDHVAAKVWAIRDPFGEMHLFSNLAEWARNNTHRFKDDYPDSITSFPVRIAGGICDLIKKNGKSCSYKGWVIVSRLELDAGGVDLLGRKYFESE